MSESDIGIEDWFAVRQHIDRYIWNFDMGDIEQLLKSFTDDAIFQDSAENEYVGQQAIKGYFDGLIFSPEFRGRRHHIDNLLITRQPDGYNVRSYWTITKWYSDQNEKKIDALGHSFDRIVTGPAGPKFAERRVYYWRDDTCPWHPSGTGLC